MKIHKNLHVVAFVAAMMAFGTQAAPVTDADAVRGAVSAWAAANGNALANPGTAESAVPAYDDDGATILYWIVSMSNGGAVIASADTDIDLVVAVLEKHDGAFPAGHPLPSMLKADLRNRLSVISGRGVIAPTGGGKSYAGPAAAAASGGGTGSPSPSAGTAEISGTVRESMAAANAQWAKYGAAGAGKGRPMLRGASLDGGDASPYVRRIVDGFEENGRYTFWDQSSLWGGRSTCFNAYTPHNAVCGCVATAGSAILQFFNCTNDPGVVTSTEASINGSKKGFSTIAGATDWSVLPENLVYGTDGWEAPGDAGYELLGRVAYNMGVLVDMEWTTSPEGSGAQTRKLADAFKKYGFKTARYVDYSGDEDTDGTEFFKTLYAQLWCGAPAVLSIRGTPGGHAVVACGYARDADGDEFCRVFMGWGGSGDSWYKFPKVDDYSQVNGAVTMIGYEDDAVVPVYGSANIPGIKLTLPGYVTNGVAVTVPVDGNGFFGVRVPMSLESPGRYITYAERGISLEIAPFDDSVIADEDAGREALDGALPNELLFSVLNMDMRSTVASARAVALRDGKALLMVSGTPGSSRTVNLLNSLYALDDTTDLSNRFVMVFTSVKSADVNGVDGDPSIGVFDPAVGSADLRWWFENGRLTYTNFIEGADISTGELVYSIDTMTAGEITASVTDLLDEGHLTYLRRHSDIAVKVTGVDLYSGSDDPFEVGVPSPAYGVHSNTWTNCEAVVFSAPGAYTNFEEGVVYSCVGWSTNTVFSGAAPGYTSGDNVTLSLASGEKITFTWVWKVSQFRVTAAGMLPYGTATGLVSPEEAWCEAGGRITLFAVDAVESYGLNTWALQRVTPAAVAGGDYAEFYGDYAMVARNGSAISFSVYEPVNVVAKYRAGSAAAAPRSYTVTVSSEPAELADLASLAGGVAWGENTLYDSMAYLAPAAESYTDSTGGVWACTGWRVGDKTYPSSGITVPLPASATCLWELQIPQDPEPDPPTPGPISITGIEKASDGSWTITVSGAVKDCWYWLYATDDLAKIAGDSGSWTASKATTTAGSNPQQATADDVPIVFHATAAGSNLFWRAKATSTETGK